MPHIRSAVALALATLGPATTLAVGPAHATGDGTPLPLVVCTGSQTTTYTPPLGPLPRTTAVGTGEGLTCTGGSFSTGTATASFIEQASCLVPPLAGGTVPPADVITYHWNDGHSSTITYTVTTVVHAANQTVVTAAGTVTSGYLLGAVAEREDITVDLDVLGCLSSAIDEGHATETLTLA
jgi:hypothetical protein